LFFACCDSVAAPRQRPEHNDQKTAKINELRRGYRPRHHDQVPATHNGRCSGQRPGHHAKIPARRRGQQPGAATKYLRRTTSAAAGSCLGTTINKHIPTIHNERPRGQRPEHHDQVSACKTSGAADDGFCTTTKYLRGATGIGLGTTIKYLRRITSAAAKNGVGATIKYLVN
jgi:hypothetical protein